MNKVTILVPYENIVLLNFGHSFLLILSFYDKLHSI